MIEALTFKSMVWTRKVQEKNDLSPSQESEEISSICSATAISQEYHVIFSVLGSCSKYYR